MNSKINIKAPIPEHISDDDSTGDKKHEEKFKSLFGKFKYYQINSTDDTQNHNTKDWNDKELFQSDNPSEKFVKENSTVIKNYRSYDYGTEQSDQNDFASLLSTLNILNSNLKRHTQVLLANTKYQECVNYNSNSHPSATRNSSNDSYTNKSNNAPQSNLTRTPTTPYTQRMSGNTGTSTNDKSNISELYPVASIGFHHQPSRNRKMFSLDELMDCNQNRKPVKSGRQFTSDTPLETQESVLTAPVEIVRNKKTTIQARIVFLKLGEIDTLHDRFNSSVFIQARWREPALDNTFFKETDIINWEKYWTPKLFIENVFGDIREQIDLSVTYDSQGKATVWEKRRILSQFQEFMELNKFPFDTQDLTVTLTSERTDEEVEIVEDAHEKCALNAQSFVGEQEWKLHRIVETWKKTRCDDNKAPKTVHSAFSAACKASRRPEFFIWNIFVVMFLICSLSFATFSVEMNLPQNRLQLSFILLLTTVSFKFVVNQSLPMIAYLTYLDKYILGSMCILCCICVWHSIVPLFNSGKECCDAAALFADTLALSILSSIYILFHVIFIFFIAFVTSKTRRYDKRSDSFSEIFYKNSDVSRSEATP